MLLRPSSSGKGLGYNHKRSRFEAQWDQKSLLIKKERGWGWVWVEANPNDKANIRGNRRKTRTQFQSSNSTIS